MDINLEKWLPHTPPMLMISQVKAYSEQEVTAISQINPDNPLIENECFPCVGGIELFAQTAGILFNYRQSAEKSSVDLHYPGKSTTPPGAVIQIKSFEVGNHKIPIGAVLLITSHYLGGNEQAAMMSGEVCYQNHTIFKGSLMIALLNNSKYES